MSGPPTHSAARLGRQAGGFALVGVLGFAIDAGMFWLLSHSLAQLTARALAFIPATLATWALNRRAVFRSERQGRRALLQEYLRYLLVQGLGIALNFGTFVLCLRWGGNALLALLLGSGIAMLFNFTGAKLLVFGR